MIVLLIITALSLLISLYFDRQKTKKGLQIALKKFLKILPVFLEMLVLVAIILYLLPADTIKHYLSGSNSIISLILAMGLGSVTAMPGFIVFPLGGILVRQGISYSIIAMFTTTLMMVGVVTFPIEKEYLGVKLAVIRNLVGLIIAVIVTFAIAIAYQEIHL